MSLYFASKLAKATMAAVLNTTDTVTYILSVGAEFGASHVCCSTGHRSKFPKATA